MFSGLIVCLLVAGAMASKPGRPFGAVHGVGAPPAHEDHEPCCAPRYFTFSQVNIMTSVVEGSLLVDYSNVVGAYDSVSERFSIKGVNDFLNGTEYFFKYIADYEEEESFFILKDGEEVTCYVDKLTDKFNEDCLPKDAKLVAETTLGDHSLLVDSWYYASEDGTEHTIKSVQHEGCVPIKLFSREFDPATGMEIEVNEASLFDFNLGICDPDEYFKPPAECDKGRALAKPTAKMSQKMQKIRGKHLFL